MRERGPMVVVELTLANGTLLRREWGPDTQSLPDILKAPVPAYLAKMRKTWPHPQDPITYYAAVDEGCEDEAREWLAGAS